MGGTWKRKKSLHTQSSLISLLHLNNKEDVDFHTHHITTHTDQKAAFLYRPSF